MRIIIKFIFFITVITLFGCKGRDYELSQYSMILNNNANLYLKANSIYEVERALKRDIEDAIIYSKSKHESIRTMAWYSLFLSSGRLAIVNYEQCDFESMKNALNAAIHSYRMSISDAERMTDIDCIRDILVTVVKLDHGSKTWWSENWNDVSINNIIGHFEKLTYYNNHPQATH